MDRRVESPARSDSERTAADSTSSLATKLKRKMKPSKHTSRESAWITDSIYSGTYTHTSIVSSWMQYQPQYL